MLNVVGNKLLTYNAAGLNKPFTKCRFRSSQERWILEWIFASWKTNFSPKIVYFLKKLVHGPLVRGGTIGYSKNPLSIHVPVMTGTIMLSDVGLYDLMATLQWSVFSQKKTVAQTYNIRSIREVPPTPKKDMNVFNPMSFWGIFGAKLVSYKLEILEILEPLPMWVQDAMFSKWFLPAVLHISFKVKKFATPLCLLQ